MNETEQTYLKRLIPKEYTLTQLQILMNKRFNKFFTEDEIRFNQITIIIKVIYD